MTLWLLRSIATAMLFAGIAVLVAGMPLLLMLSGVPVARTITGILFQISGVVAVSGAAALFLARPLRLPLPNERATIADAERPAVGGWLAGLAIILVALPLWLVLRLQPFLAGWGQVVDFLATTGILQGANANMSGVVLLPVAAALTPPFLELMAMAGFVASSATLLALLLARSWRFPRVYLVCMVLLSGLVIASARGADAALLAGDAAQQLIDSSNPRPGEAELLRDGVSRYTSLVASTAPVLTWTLLGYLVWVPAMILSRRAQTTFAQGAAAASARALDIQAITSPPPFPG